MTAPDEYEALVRDVARKFAETDYPETNWDDSDGFTPSMRKHYLKAARAILALIAERLEKPTEAMVIEIARELCYRYELEDGFGETASRAAANSDMHKNFVRTARAVAMICASPLKPKIPS